MKYYYLACKQLILSKLKCCYLLLLNVAVFANWIVKYLPCACFLTQHLPQKEHLPKLKRVHLNAQDTKLFSALKLNR